MSEPQSGAALLARIKPQLKEVEANLCLRPDILDALDAANAELEELMASRPQSRLADAMPAEAKKIAKRIEKLREDADAAQVTFRFRALTNAAWTALLEKHPPRPTNDMDRIAGYDRQAAIDAAVRACLVDPVFEDCASQDCAAAGHADCGSWQEFLAVCNPSEWAHLRNRATEANGATVDVPKSPLASQVLGRPASA